MEKRSIGRGKRLTKRRQHHSSSQKQFHNSNDNDEDESESVATITKTRSKNIHAKSCNDKSQHRAKNGYIVGFLTVGFLLIILTAVLFYKKEEPRIIYLPDPEVPLPPSWSTLKTFKKGAICVDSAQCAMIGKSVLEQSGSAVDAALSSLICNGLMNMQSMGLGGGFLMTIYDRKLRKAVVLNAKETAPLKAHEHMFNNELTESNQSGPLSVAVPGELAGYWAAHQRYGKLPWSTLFEPSIQLCESGYNLTKGLHDDLLNNRDKIYNSDELKTIFVDPSTGEFRRPGETIRPMSQLCKTLRILSERNATELYGGVIGERLVEDVEDAGGIITLDDLKNYKVRWEDPVQSTFSDFVLYTPGLPGSGAFLTLILNILEGYSFKAESISDTNSTVLTYHRILESFKYAFGIRTKLGDPDFVEMSGWHEKLSSKEYAKLVRALIMDNKTFTDPSHYGSDETDGFKDHGTTHISVVDSSGNAVSVTSTVNIYFGSGIVSKRTGILLNSGMDDFGVPSRLNYFGIPASPANHIKAGKRSLSSMAPTILVDSNGNVKMVIGAAGGTKIVTSIAFVLMRFLWMGDDLKKAIDAPRIHHQLYPMEVSYEYGVLKQVLQGLEELGHKTSRYRERGSVINSIVQSDSTLYANVDYRKSSGNAFGLD